MERRNFFKNAGLIASGAIVGKTCNFISNKDTKKNSLPRVQVSIAFHCNLNCAYCSHFASIAPRSFYPLDTFEKDLEQFSKITKGNIREFKILGGEPLLNKDIEEYINISRKYLKNSTIIIETNGLLLNNMKDNFWKTCNKNAIKIQYSYYPLYKNYPNLKEAYLKAEKYNVALTSNNPRYAFSLMHLNKKANRDIKKAYNECDSKIICSVLNNGILYPCFLLAGVDLIFNKHFKNYAFEINKEDYLDIYKTNSIDEILEFYKKPKNLCRHCKVGGGGIELTPDRKIWKQSNMELSEWYDV